MCMGTDAAADCTAGRCRFQEEVEEEGRRRAEEEKLERGFSPLDDLPPRFPFHGEPE